jgi:hypothetical protein
MFNKAALIRGWFTVATIFTCLPLAVILGITILPVHVFLAHRGYCRDGYQLGIVWRVEKTNMIVSLIKTGHHEASFYITLVRSDSQQQT